MFPTAKPPSTSDGLRSSDPAVTQLPNESNANHRPQKRTSNACISCRQSKVKCSGTQPCTNCLRRRIECMLPGDGRRVTVSEKYLRALEQRARSNTASSKRSQSRALSSEKRQQGTSANAVGSDSSGVVGEGPAACSSSAPSAPLNDHNEDNSEAHDWPSPFTLPSTTMRNTHHTKRRWIYLPPCSTWAFSLILTFMLTEKLHPCRERDIPYTADGEVYTLEWSSVPRNNQVDTSGIPPLDYTIYLFNTVKFHLCQSFRLFDEHSFLANVQEFYHDAERKVAESRLWFIQFLLIIAFGKAFLSQTNKSSQPAGAAFFTRAMSLMPEYGVFWEQDPIVAIEILALASVYLYSIDRRESAYLYICQAVNVAQMEGLHTQLPVKDLGLEVVERCTNLWWSIYIIERQLSSSLGLPSSVQDSDVTTSLNSPKDASQRDVTLRLHVKVARLKSSTLKGLYSANRDLGQSFLDQTKLELQTMAGLAKELEDTINSRFKNSVNTLSKGTLEITLSYHQYVILATRPLLLAVLKERLKCIERPSETPRRISSLMKTLISTCIDSANKSLRILLALMEGGLLGHFLPFDLEFTYGAAIALLITSTLFLGTVQSQDFELQAHLILDEMYAKGNRLAQVRKEELQRLRVLFDEYRQLEHDRTKVNAPGLPTTNSLNKAPPPPPAAVDQSFENAYNAIASDELRLSADQQHSWAPPLQMNAFDENDISLDGSLLAVLGISSDTMSSVADQITYDFSATNNGQDDWRWEVN